MRISLRNEHRYGWFILGPIVLAVVLLAWKYNPARLHPEDVRTFSDDGITVSISPSGGSGYQLNVGLREMPVAPSVYVFVSPDALQSTREGVAIGLIDHNGGHTFPLPIESASWQIIYATLADVVRDSILYQTRLDQ